MKSILLTISPALLLSALASPTFAQEAEQTSVGRGAPVATEIEVPISYGPLGQGALELPPGGPAGAPGAGAPDAGAGGPPGEGPAPAGGALFGPPPSPPVEALTASQGGVPPDGVEPLQRDIFTTPDFYKDADLYTDPRYWRCNSPIAIASFWGDYLSMDAVITSPEESPWGFCDRDYPREAIVSPYSFKTAGEHYEALLSEAKARGGPTQYTAQNPPPDWNGSYEVLDMGQMTMGGQGIDGIPYWYNMHINQVSTIMSLLTPTYQRYYAQQMYHVVRSRSAQWPASYCWPEGLGRFYNWVGMNRLDVYTATDQVLFLGQGLSASFPRPVQIGREFNTDTGGVPNLNGAVPRWYGETVGFWDEQALITWTSNVQGWYAHDVPEYSSQTQLIEVWTPLRNEAGELTGLSQETVWYDPEALVEPVRLFRHIKRAHGLSEGMTYAYGECLQTLYPQGGRASAVSPGSKITIEATDWFNRPWARQWEQYFEEGLERPEGEALFGF